MVLPWAAALAVTTIAQWLCLRRGRDRAVRLVLALLVVASAIGTTPSSSSAATPAPRPCGAPRTDPRLGEIPPFGVLRPPVPREVGFRRAGGAADDARSGAGDAADGLVVCRVLRVRVTDQVGGRRGGTGHPRLHRVGRARHRDRVPGERDVVLVHERRGTCGRQPARRGSTAAPS